MTLNKNDWAKLIDEIQADINETDPNDCSEEDINYIVDCLFKISDMILKFAEKCKPENKTAKHNDVTASTEKPMEFMC